MWATTPFGLVLLFYMFSHPHSHLHGAFFKLMFGGVGGVGRGASFEKEIVIGFRVHLGLSCFAIGHPFWETYWCLLQLVDSLD